MKASARNVSCHCVKYQEGKKRGMGKGKGERAERKEKEWLLGKQLKWKECSMGWKETDNDRMMKKYREKRMDRKGVERARREPEKMWRQMGSIKKERRRSKKSGRDRLKCQKVEGTSRKPKNPNLSANMREKRFGWAEWRSKHEGKNTKVQFCLQLPFLEHGALGLLWTLYGKRCS